MSLQEKFFESGNVTTFDSAMDLVRSGDVNDICRGITQISILYMNSLLPYEGRDDLMFGTIRSLDEKKQKMIAGATIMAFRLNKELPGSLEYWAIKKLPEFNQWTLKAIEGRSGFFKRPTHH